MASVRIVVNLGKGLSSREPGKTRTCATQFQVHHRTKLQPNCCFYYPLTWPLCVIPCFLCFASCSVAILNDTQDVIMHVIPIAGSDPTSLCFVWFGCGCVFLVCLVSFVSGCVFCLVSCWDSSLDCVQVHYHYFCGYRQVDSLA